MRNFLKYPSDSLKPYVNFYWGLESDTIEKIPEQLIYPEGSTELLFHYEEPFLSKNSFEKIIPQYRINFSGQKSKSINVLTNGKIGMTAVNFKPFGAFVFFNLPFEELVNKNLDLESFNFKNSSQVLEKLYLSNSFNDRVDIIEELLLSLISWERALLLERLSFAYSKMLEQFYSFKVDDFAKLACISNKSLDRLFNRTIGLMPKEFLIIERIKNAIERIKNNSDDNLTEIAYYAGYYDQSHFCKDFNSIVGLKPKQFLRLINSDPICLETIYI